MATFWQNFGLNFPFFGTDRAGGMFGGTFRPEDQLPGPMGHPVEGGFPGAAGAAGAAPMGAGAPAASGALGGGGMARPAPTGAAVAQPPMGPVSSPLGPGGMAGGALSAPIAPGQQRQPERFGGGRGQPDRERLAELLRSSPWYDETAGLLRQ